MKIETLPLIVGAIVGIVGLLLLFDAWTPDETVIPRERRRAARSERSRGGETAIGFGVLCLAAAILGRDTWPYTIVSAIAGAVLVLVGGIMSRRYIKGRLVTYVDEPLAAHDQVVPPTDRALSRDSECDDISEPQRGRPASDATGPVPRTEPPTDRGSPEPAPGSRLRIR